MFIILCLVISTYLIFFLIFDIGEVQTAVPLELINTHLGSPVSRSCSRNCCRSSSWITSIIAIPLQYLFSLQAIELC